MKRIGHIVEGAIQNKNIVYLFLFLLLAAGVVGLTRMNKDEFPPFEINQGLVAAVYPGADVFQVEEEVAKPLEKMLFSMSEVDRKNTKVCTKDGICYVYVSITTPPSKKDETWSKLRLKMAEFKQTLPLGVLALVAIDDFSDLTSILISLESSDKGYIEMKEYADRLADRLREIPNLSSVSIIGTQDEEIAVVVDIDKLASYGLSTSTLLMNYQTAGLQTLGGTFSTSYTSAPVHVSKIVTDEEELAERIVFSTPTGEMLRLHDIATITRRFKDPSAMVTYNGHSAIILSVAMRPDNNIISFGEEVDEVLNTFMREMPASVSISRITDQPKVVDTSIFNFLRDLVISMLVVIAVMLMLFPMRSALIASSGVPVCTAIALALMWLFNINLNTVTLAGLIVCLGMIVDDSIITIDGYLDKLGHGKTPLEAATSSAKELFVPMFMATFSISAMFFPTKYIISGYLGDFVSMFPWVIAFALLTSLAYAVFVVPSLEVKYIHSVTPAKQSLITRMQNGLFKGLQLFFEWMQAHCFRHPHFTIFIGLFTIALGLLFFSRTNIQMMPMAARPYFAVEIYLDPSSDLSESAQVSDSLSRMLRRDKRIVSVTEFIGTGTPRFHCTYSPILPGKNMAQLIVNTRSEKATESFLHDFETYYEHYFPNAQIHFKQMDYQGTSTPMEVLISGDNYEDLRPLADSIKAYMTTMNNLKWVHNDADGVLSTLSVELNADDAVRLGVNRTMMNLSLAGMLNGLQLTSIREGDHVIPVYFYAENIGKESTYDVLSNALIPTSVPGISVPIRQVARISPEWNPESLVRLNGKPTISVGADMKLNCSQVDAAREVQAYIDRDLEIPQGVEVTLGGLSKSNENVIPEIVLSFSAAVLVLFFFLVFHFKKISLAILTIILSTLCFFGAFFGLWLFGLDFSITAVLGLISLVGIIVRNGIIMFEYAEELRFAEGYSVFDAAVESGKRRMRPIFLTSCTTALGVLPMIISGDLLWMPMGVVICFGTLLSVFLITLIMPISYWLIFRRADKQLIKNEKTI